VKLNAALVFLSQFRYLPGHVGGVDLGQLEAVVGCQVPSLERQIWIGLSFGSDLDIDPAVGGISLAGGDDLLEKGIGSALRQCLFVPLGVYLHQVEKNAGDANPDSNVQNYFSRLVHGNFDHDLMDQP
jgi:hypothetical protein